MSNSKNNINRKGANKERYAHTFIFLFFCFSCEKPSRSRAVSPVWPKTEPNTGKDIAQYLFGANYYDFFSH